MLFHMACNIPINNETESLKVIVDLLTFLSLKRSFQIFSKIFFEVLKSTFFIPQSFNLGLQRDQKIKIKVECYITN